MKHVAIMFHFVCLQKIKQLIKPFQELSVKISDFGQFISLEGNNSVFFV